MGQRLHRSIVMTTALMAVLVLLCVEEVHSARLASKHSKRPGMKVKRRAYGHGPGEHFEMFKHHPGLKARFPRHGVHGFRIHADYTLADPAPAPQETAPSAATATPVNGDAPDVLLQLKEKHQPLSDAMHDLKTLEKDLQSSVHDFMKARKSSHSSKHHMRARGKSSFLSTAARTTASDVSGNAFFRAVSEGSYGTVRTFSLEAEVPSGIPMMHVYAVFEGEHKTAKKNVTESTVGGGLTLGLKFGLGPIGLMVYIKGAIELKGEYEVIGDLLGEYIAWLMGQYSGAIEKVRDDAIKKLKKDLAEVVQKKFLDDLQIKAAYIGRNFRKAMEDNDVLENLLKDRATYDRTALHHAWDPMEQMLNGHTKLNGIPFFDELKKEIKDATGAVFQDIKGKLSDILKDYGVSDYLAMTDEMSFKNECEAAFGIGMRNAINDASDLTEEVADIFSAELSDQVDRFAAKITGLSGWFSSFFDQANPQHVGFTVTLKKLTMEEASDDARENMGGELAAASISIKESGHTWDSSDSITTAYTAPVMGGNEWHFHDQKLHMSGEGKEFKLNAEIWSKGYFLPGKDGNLEQVIKFNPFTLSFPNRDDNVSGSLNRDICTVQAAGLDCKLPIVHGSDNRGELHVHIEKAGADKDAINEALTELGWYVHMLHAKLMSWEGLFLDQQGMDCAQAQTEVSKCIGAKSTHCREKDQIFLASHAICERGSERGILRANKNTLVLDMLKPIQSSMKDGVLKDKWALSSLTGQGKILDSTDGNPDGRISYFGRAERIEFSHGLEVGVGVFFKQPKVLTSDLEFETHVSFGFGGRGKFVPPSSISPADQANREVFLKNPKREQEKGRALQDKNLLDEWDAFFPVAIAAEVKIDFMKVSLEGTLAFQKHPDKAGTGWGVSLHDTELKVGMSFHLRNRETFALGDDGTVANNKAFREKYLPVITGVARGIIDSADLIRQYTTKTSERESVLNTKNPDNMTAAEKKELNEEVDDRQTKAGSPYKKFFQFVVSQITQAFNAIKMTKPESADPNIKTIGQQFADDFKDPGTVSDKLDAEFKKHSQQLVIGGSLVFVWEDKNWPESNRDLLDPPPMPQNAQNAQQGQQQQQQAADTAAKFWEDDFQAEKPKLAFSVAATRKIGLEISVPGMHAVSLDVNTKDGISVDLVKLLSDDEPQP